MYENEKWADVPGYEGFYQVSDHGRVVRCKQLLPSLTAQGARVHLNLLTPISRYAGRLSVSLCAYNEPKWFQIHRLVLTAFKGAAPDGYYGLHNDGDHLNNHIDNLRWGTQRDNMHDKVRHGTQTRGAAHPTSKLMESDIREIRASRETQRTLAAQYGVSQVAINHIRTRKTWKHVA